MKILIDIRKLSDKPDGIGYFGSDLVNQLISNMPNAQIIGITDVKRGNLIGQLENKINIIEYGSRIDKTTQILKYFRFLYKNVVNIKPDYLLQLNFFIPFHVKGVKNISVIHDIIPIEHPSYFSVIYNIYFRLMLYFTRKYMNAIIFNSNYTKRTYFRKYKREIPHVVSYPFLTKEIKIPPKDNEEQYLLYLGFACKRKGIDILLKSYLKIVNETNLTLVVAGGSDSFGEKKLRKYKNILKDKLRVLNYVSDVEKNKLLNSCFALIFPSRAEGFGIPIYEALLHNRRVIASNLEVFNEVFGNEIKYFDLNNNVVNNLSKEILLLEKSKKDGKGINITTEQNSEQLCQLFS